MRLAAVLVTVSLLSFAPPAYAQRAVQVSPDGATLLINKPFGGQEWSIVVNFDAQTVAGNVFNLDGGDPQFVYCTIATPAIASPADFIGLANVTLQCHGSVGCGAFPCSPAEWTDLGETQVVGSFFVPPVPSPTPTAGPSNCGMHFSDGCTGTGDVAFAAAGGRTFVEGHGDIASGGSSLGVSFSGFHSLLLELVNIPQSLALVFAFSGNSVTTIDSGRIVAETFNDSGGAVCIDESGTPKRIIRAAHQRVEICKVCGIGHAVLGSFDATYQVEDGSECQQRGEFMMFRQQ
jgi:hypothetical protein